MIVTRTVPCLNKFKRPRSENISVRPSIKLLRKIAMLYAYKITESKVDTCADKRIENLISSIVRTSIVRFGDVPVKNT